MPNEMDFGWGKSHRFHSIAEALNKQIHDQGYAHTGLDR
jgi:hypothetical protein